jgi:hypothetical protein
MNSGDLLSGAPDPFPAVEPLLLRQSEQPAPGAPSSLLNRIRRSQLLMSALETAGAALKPRELHWLEPLDEVAAVASQCAWPFRGGSMRSRAHSGHPRPHATLWAARSINDHTSDSVPGWASSLSRPSQPIPRPPQRLARPIPPGSIRRERPPPLNSAHRTPVASLDPRAPHRGRGREFRRELDAEWTLCASTPRR